MSPPARRRPLAVFLNPGDFYCARRPAVVETILGSCVAITLYSSRLRTGAICHAMLPYPAEGSRAGEFVEGAISAILERMTGCGARRDELETKLFGGSTVLTLQDENGTQRDSLGDQNINAALATLASLGLRLKARDTGGDTGRKLFFFTETGDVYVRRQKSSPAKRAAASMEQ